MREIARRLLGRILDRRTPYIAKVDERFEQAPRERLAEVLIGRCPHGNLADWCLTCAGEVGVHPTIDLGDVLKFGRREGPR